MDEQAMSLKIFLPYRIFLESRSNVSRIVFETYEGSFGLLPNRLDCASALVPGIFTYEIVGEGMKYLAIDQGILIKTGKEVCVSVRNAIGGADLGTLQETVKKSFKELGEREIKVRSVMDKMEVAFMHNFDKLLRED